MCLLRVIHIRETQDTQPPKHFPTTELCQTIKSHGVRAHLIKHPQYHVKGSGSSPLALPPGWKVHNCEALPNCEAFPICRGREKASQSVKQYCRYLSLAPFLLNASVLYQIKKMGIILKRQ